MSGQPPPEEPGQATPTPEEPDPTFRERMEAASGFRPLVSMPAPIDLRQAQRAFEKRALWEDFTAHIIALVLTSGFFMLAFAALLGFVDLSNSAAATFLGTVMGYAVGKIDPILTRYFQGVNPRATQPPPIDVTPAPSEEKK